MHLLFCGAVGEVTGSCTKVDIEQATLLVDCGLFQGGKYAEDANYDPFPFKSEDIDALVLTHAHLDHCGRIPKLVNTGFVGKIYCTEATRDLMQLILLDAAGLMSEEAEREDRPPLYTEEDVVSAIERVVPLPYDRETEIANGVTVTLRNAGHVLGSAFVELSGEGKRVIFSGDLGNYPVPLLPKAEKLPVADALVMESTYGNKVHGRYTEGIKVVEEAIRKTKANNGVLLIPAFSLERTQELLTVIDESLSASRVPAISAYLDGPLGIKISRIYQKYDDYFNNPIHELEKREPDHSVLMFPHLTLTETTEQSKMINDVDPPKMIIAGSGMMHGGRILHHLKRYLPFPNTTLLVVGYQAHGTLGRNLLDGAKKVTIHGENVEVKADIEVTPAFSSHMDEDQLVAWLKTMPTPPKVIFLNHGDDNARQVMAEKLGEMSLKVYMPRYNSGYTVGREDESEPKINNESHSTASR